MARLRNGADYNLGTLKVFATARVANDAIRDVALAIGLLDTIDNNLTRRANVVAAIRKAFP